MSSPASMLAVESLTMAFGGVRAIDELSFRIRPGPVHSII
ncbi:MAG: ABC transporter ATP-binding protein, partial [Burkholderiaceae bacterium]|nr:ABC transporter ATP-binding protein [Burkholderiaceae bacterium]